MRQSVKNRTRYEKCTLVPFFVQQLASVRILKFYSKKQVVFLLQMPMHCAECALLPYDRFLLGHSCLQSCNECSRPTYARRWCIWYCKHEPCFQHILRGRFGRKKKYGHFLDAPNTVNDIKILHIISWKSKLLVFIMSDSYFAILFTVRAFFNRPLMYRFQTTTDRGFQSKKCISKCKI